MDDNWPVEDPQPTNEQESPTEAAPAPAELKRIEWPNRLGRSLAHVGRSVKMVQPLCRSCQPLGGRWWLMCPHDPYFSHVEREISEPIIEEKDGERLVTGRKVKVVEVVAPNVRQIGTARNQSSGRGVDLALRKGYKHLEDLGFAPMCEYLGCYSHDITVRSRYGNFCREAEARQVALRVLEKPVEIHNQRRAEAQAQEISL